VSLCGLAIYIKKVFESKTRIIETQIFHHSKNIPNLQNNPLKANQNPARYYYNSITNPQVSTQAKISSFKNPHINNRHIIT
jgi:hypothetical protein